MVNICPYHYARWVINHVDILLANYNYVLNPSIRSSVGLKLDDSVIIFDEVSLYYVYIIIYL